MSGGPAGYAGEISPAEAWERLKSDVQAVLVDVRTPGEWSFVGVPRLDAIGKAPLLVEWPTTTAATTVDFVRRLEAELAGMGVAESAPLYFICRSGSRSRHAAIAMTAAGHDKCFNVSSGFEGPLDHDGHRGAAAGWKVSGLPWIQS